MVWKESAWSVVTLAMSLLAADAAASDRSVVGDPGLRQFLQFLRGRNTSFHERRQRTVDGECVASRRRHDHGCLGRL